MWVHIYIYVYIYMYIYIYVYNYNIYIYIHINIVSTNDQRMNPRAQVGHFEEAIGQALNMLLSHGLIISKDRWCKDLSLPGCPT